MNQTLQRIGFTIFRLSRYRRHSPDPRKVGMTSHFIRPLNTVAFGIALLLSTRADGAELKSMSLYEDAKTLSANPMFQWSATVRITTAPTYSVLTSSCVAVAPTLVLGAGHFTPGPTSQSVVNEVIFGPNYNSSSALHIEVDHWERFTGYVSGDPNTIWLLLVKVTNSRIHKPYNYWKYWAR